MSFGINSNNPTISKIHEFNNNCNQLNPDQKKLKIKQLSKDILMDQGIKKIEDMKAVVSLILDPSDRQEVCH